MSEIEKGNFSEHDITSEEFQEKMKGGEKLEKKKSPDVAQKETPEEVAGKIADARKGLEQVEEKGAEAENISFSKNLEELSKILEGVKGYPSHDNDLSKISNLIENLEKTEEGKDGLSDFLKERGINPTKITVSAREIVDLEVDRKIESAIQQAIDECGFSDKRGLDSDNYMQFDLAITQHMSHPLYDAFLEELESDIKNFESAAIFSGEEPQPSIFTRLLGSKNFEKAKEAYNRRLSKKRRAQEDLPNLKLLLEKVKKIKEKYDNEKY